jgi:4-amino-4-deoxy-L-arabinose transferase-like glycosyltransferase
MLGIEARLAKTDALLLAAILVAMGVLARAYVGDPRFTRSGLAGWVLPAMFWTALAGGILIKGPLILMFVGLATATLVVLERSVRWLGALRPIAGLAWMSALVLPWFIAIVGRAGEAFFAESIGQDLLAKVVSSQEAHGAPPGYYFLLFWLTFWPGSALAAMAAPAVWASRYEKGARFLLAWIVPAWILLELVVTKLPHYVLPLYPAIAILIAGIADSHMLARRPWLTRGASWWFTLPVLLGIGGILGLMIYGRQFGLLAWPFAAGAVILGLFAWRLYETDGVELSLMRGMAAAILLAVSTYAVILPSLTALFPSAALARVLREGNCEHPVAAAAGYHEPSLVFLLGTPTRLTDGTNAAEFLRQGGCRYALIEARQERSFLRRADAIGLRYSFGPRIEGLNVASGRPVSIAVYRSEASP